MKDPIQLYLIGGFLGAGKTTFLRLLMEDMKTKRMGILVNEFGSIGVDGALIEREGVRMVEINNGSIFCACLKDGFVNTLKAFTEQPVDVLLIENSGMADPAGMHTILSNLAPYLSRPYDYRGLICLVDCTTFLQYSEVLMPVQGQVADADYVIVNKCDLVDQNVITKIHERIRSLNDSAQIYDTVFAQIPLPLPESTAHHQEGKERESSNTPFTRPATYALETDSTPNQEQLFDFCHSIGESALRIKGFVRAADGWLHVDAVGKEVQISPAVIKNKFRLNRGKLVIIGRDGHDIQSEIQTAWQKHCASSFELKIS